MELRADTTMSGAVPIVAFSGTIDLATVGVLHDQLLRATTDHPGRRVVVDLDAVDVLADVGLGVLLGAAGRAREAGGDLVVVVTSERVRRRFTVTGFDRAVLLAGGLAEVVTRD